MRPRSHVTQKERRRLTLSGFRGVDLTSNPLEVASYRATYMRNMISDGGVNHKRPGWREIYNFGEKINGVFEYSDGAYKETIFQAGARFYRLLPKGTVEDITETCTYAPAELDQSILNADGRSQGFMLNGSLYIIGCGDFLVYEKYGTRRELRRVCDNETTYVPTTTYGAMGEYYDTANKSWVSSKGGTFLDDINMLSRSRKNSFIGFATEKSEFVAVVKYSLDGYIAKNSLVEILVEARYGGGGIVYSDGTLVDPGSSLLGTRLWEESRLGGADESLDRVTISRGYGTYTIKNSEDDYESLYEINSDGTRGAKVGRIAEVGGWGKDIYLYSIYAPRVEFQPNITVTFTPDNYSHKEDLHSRITKCSFGTRFGTEKIADRLFLSGNKAYSNIDFYSEEQDFTYFGELSTAALGDSSTSIEGYGRLSDSSLVVYKSESNNEPSFFYRSARYYDEYDNEGNIQKMYGIFPHTEGAVGEGVVSRYAHANLCGDVIFLSRSGVHGIVLSENMLTTERYMRERSRNIRNALAAHSDLSEAVGIVYNNRYYLAIDGICYVGDARYKFEASGDIDGSYNYEWWVWDNIPARVFGKIGTELYFGTDDGRICVFDDEFTDRTYDHTEAGDLSIDNAHGEVVYNATSGVLSSLCKGDRLIFSTGNIYAIVDSGMRLDGERIFTSESAISSIFSGMTVYIGNAGDSGLEEGIPYTIGDIDRDGFSYALYRDGEPVTPAADGFKVFVSVSGKKLYIADDPSDGRFAVRENPEGEILRLAIYDDVVLSPLATIEHAHNVVAEWVTPVTDLGTSVESKSLVGMTLSARPVKNGRISFGYETRTASSMIAAQGLNTFSLEDFSFMDFTFDTGFQNSFTVRCHERNFNYIVFRFLSDSDTDCVINGLTVDYKINKSNKGVR